MSTLGVLDSTFGVVEKGTNAPNLIHNPPLFGILKQVQVTAFLSAKFSSVMTINNGSIIESTELKLLIYHIRSMNTLGVLDSTFGVVEKGINAPNIIHNPLL